MKIFISPKFTVEDFRDGMTVDDKINVFSDRIEGWVFDVCQALIQKDVPHRGLAILSLVTGIFETIGKHLYGYTNNSESRKHFVLGGRHFFEGYLDQEGKQILDEKFVDDLMSGLYQEIRNPLFHASVISGRVIILDDIPAPIGYREDSGQILISPDKFFTAVQIGFRQFITELQNPNNKELRTNFESRYDYVAHN